MFSNCDFDKVGPAMFVFADHIIDMVSPFENPGIPRGSSATRAIIEGPA